MLENLSREGNNKRLSFPKKTFLLFSQVSAIKTNWKVYKVYERKELSNK